MDFEAGQEVSNLLTLCIEYVAKNVSLVDSLVGYPEVMGKQIFEAAVRLGGLTLNNPTTQKALQVFVEAYGKEFIEAFCCKDLCFISEYCENLQVLLQPVTHLDLSDCNFGDECDILKTLPYLDNIKVLNIANNKLSDDGLRLLLMRYKVYKTGFDALESLDISRNEVSPKILRTILTFPKLRQLRVSMTIKVKANGQFVSEWKTQFKRAKFVIADEAPPAETVITQGWGKPLVTLWERKIQQWEQERQERILKRRVSFYSGHFKKANALAVRAHAPAGIFETYCYVKFASGDESLSDTDSCESVKNFQRRLTFSSGKRKQEEVLWCNAKRPKLCSASQDMMGIDEELLMMYLEK